jgi:hypothetical protein
MSADCREAGTLGPSQGRERRAVPRLAGLALAAALAALAAVAAPASAATGPTAAPASGSARPQAAPPGTAAADDGAHVVAQQWIDARTLDLTIDSPAMAANEQVRLLLPPDWNTRPDERWPVLYLCTAAVTVTSAGRAPRTWSS